MPDEPMKKKQGPEAYKSPGQPQQQGGSQKPGEHTQKQGQQPQKQGTQRPGQQVPEEEE